MIDLKQDFEQARQAYPGTVRGLDTEYGYYLDCLKRKKLKEYIITPKLLPAIQDQIQQREGKAWNPGWKHFKTWIYNNWWEAVDCKGTKPQAVCEGCGGPWTSTWRDPKTGKTLKLCFPCKRSIRGY